MNTQENNKTIAQVIKTQQNNKMIAEFMEVVFHDDENQYYNADGLHIGNTLQYHTSWDWLMPVLNKIRSFDCEFDIEQIGVFEVSYGGNWIGKSISHYEFDLDLTYEAVVEFINQYNKNK